MAVALDTLRTDIEAAERAVRAADQRAANTGRALRAHWRSKGPTLMGAAGAALAAPTGTARTTQGAKGSSARPGIGWMVPRLRPLHLGAWPSGGNRS